MSKNGLPGDFKRRISYMVLVYISIIGLGLYMNLGKIAMVSMSLAFALVFAARLLSGYREVNSPTYKVDERSLSIGYKAESMCFRMGVFAMALLSLFSQGDNFLSAVLLRNTALAFVFVMLIGKTVVYHVLDKRF